ncbi:hypothetical protein B0H17DRAFT_1335626 [Mycena rosella]|uniref:Protein kinase domain-containing protein n=1 Tax=Mycena rosella TaxID=1033263 RepID=A0AAD7G5R7_MYCRO|nr:hypothetical protein B0H17DRAFT_1335626 [Mycena rosella]
MARSILSTDYNTRECANSTPPHRISYSPRESDLWALGVIFFTLVTSTIPWPVAEPSTWHFAAYRADEDNYLADAFHPRRSMRAAVLNIERYSLAHMLPTKSAAPDPHISRLSALCHSSLSTPALVVGLPTPSAPCSSASSAGPFAPPRSAHPAILDVTNIGFAAVHPPPLVPTKLYAPMTILGDPPPIKMAPEYRFLDRNKRDIATRRRFADKLSRV